MPTQAAVHCGMASCARAGMSRTTKPAPTASIPCQSSGDLRTPFPDDDHTCLPSRRAQFARLSRNALPAAPSQRKSKSVVEKNQSDNNYTEMAKNSATTTKSTRSQRIANPCDTDLWGFPVYFSPKQELRTQWTLAQSQVSLVQNQDEEGSAAGLLRVATPTKHDLSQRSRVDYAQYLYFARKYGPLDTVLYCHTSVPGRVYALLVEQSARKVQQWLQERIRALRNYWVARFAREVSSQSIAHGCEVALQSAAHQQRAVRFLRRLRWLFAAKALRSWFDYTQKQIEVRWRFQFAASQDVRTRFARWREHVDAAKRFRTQLKSVARWKRLAGAFSQWQEWRVQQEKTRQLLARRWMKTQRDCWVAWCSSVEAQKRSKGAAVRIQCCWRGFSQRKRFRRQRQASWLLARVLRGWRSRERVKRLKELMAVGETLIQLTHVVAWQDRCAVLHARRESVLANEMERFDEESECVRNAEAEVEVVVKAELGKVVRNRMHYRLQDKLRSLKESDEGVSLRSNEKAMVRLATKHLVQDMQQHAKNDAMVEFRDQRPGNRPLETCLVCHVDAECVWQDSALNRLAREGPAHVCSRSSGPDFVAVAAEIGELMEQERAFAQQIQHRVIGVPVLWQLLQHTFS